MQLTIGHLIKIILEELLLLLLLLDFDFDFFVVVVFVIVDVVGEFESCEGVGDWILSD